jgi:hypothetical protein
MLQIILAKYKTYVKYTSKNKMKRQKVKFQSLAVAEVFLLEAGGLLHTISVFWLFISLLYPKRMYFETAFCYVICLLLPPRSLHTFNHGAEPFLRSRQLCSYWRTSQHFMEPEGPLPRLHEPSTSPYSEPDRSNPYHPILILSKIHFITVHPPTSWSS